MLKHLSIKNYALIDLLEVDFEDGLQIITGETGAGKSILIGGLSLVLGKKVDLSNIKNPTKKCVIETHFKLSHYELKSFFEGKKQLIMEFFYRNMRKKYDLLMLQGQPLGGKWNFDKTNRKKWKGEPPIPQPYRTDKKGNQIVYESVVKAGIKSIGTYDVESYLFPADREEALEQLDYFCETYWFILEITKMPCIRMNAIFFTREFHLPLTLKSFTLSR